ncbi:MAG: Hsp20/alpha crystallin family protein [Verrucomicrobiae bacterium]|nr:Hsp20/alpha crystallin family protein [Verrucomicrobiae bacterium]NNJ43469.1 Hsp20/alpha crystallin family protein [Akkermansiaceae bacterium]
MITHHPLAGGIFSDLNRFVNHALESEADARCRRDEHARAECSDLESITDDADGWKLRLELPGYRKDEVMLSVDDDFLKIVAETDDDERGFLGKKERRVRISDDVDAENIKAQLENGILYLEIPRKVKEAPRSIVIT